MMNVRLLLCQRLGDRLAPEEDEQIECWVSGQLLDLIVPWRRRTVLLRVAGRYGCLGRASRSGAPASVEVQLLNQRERVYTAYVEIAADVRQLSVGPLLFRTGMLGCYNGSIFSIH